MEEHVIPIIINGRINPTFIKSNGTLILENYKRLQDCNDDNERVTNLIELWKDAYRAELIYNKDQQSWTTIKFNNEQDMTMFLLKHW